MLTDGLIYEVDGPAGYTRIIKNAKGDKFIVWKDSFPLYEIYEQHVVVVKYEPNDE